jgi:D-glycero-alpha-D-manno-heptose 1-phosphate guanylyltransferase
MSGPIRTAIVLAGGLGTRLRTVLQDLPKPMAPIGELPFLSYLLHSLEAFGVEEAILSVGYRREAIVAHYGDCYGRMALRYAVEEEPMGTGGGIRLACRMTDAEDVLILNGDTLFDVDLAAMATAHFGSTAAITLALKPMRDFDRYGTVQLDAEHQVQAFREKQPCVEGLINGGVYLLRNDTWHRIATADKFSFEKDILERYLDVLDFRGYVSEGYFIDIGIPEDYARAQVELPALFPGVKG